jgi:hypothetical protein
VAKLRGLSINKVLGLGGDVAATETLPGADAAAEIPAEVEASPAAAVEEAPA